jgi:lipopolysaccharide/colanic/teichoic acid biosynthesis glycosyltransferase
VPARTDRRGATVSAVGEAFHPDDAPGVGSAATSPVARHDVHPAFDLRSRCTGWRSWAKRGLDVVLGALLFAAALPLMVVLATLIKLGGRGPVIFRQKRIGRGGVPFEVLKFRTMYVDSTDRLAADRLLYKRYVDNDFKLRIDEDPRITRLGRVLRRSSLDELPQLLNVLRGEMSLVGPRPVLEDELVHYGSSVVAYTAVRPGITGRWQTEGRNTVRYPERAELDAAYVRDYRLREDLRILYRTIPSVLSRDGAH